MTHEEKTAYNLNKMSKIELQAFYKNRRVSVFNGSNSTRAIRGFESLKLTEADLRLKIGNIYDIDQAIRLLEGMRGNFQHGIEQEPEPNDDIVEKLMKRPSNYYYQSPKNQWAIDKQLGLLDIPDFTLTEKQAKRWNKHFRLNELGLKQDR